MRKAQILWSGTRAQRADEHLAMLLLTTLTKPCLESGLVKWPTRHAHCQVKLVHAKQFDTHHTPYAKYLASGLRVQPVAPDTGCT